MNVAEPQELNREDFLQLLEERIHAAFGISLAEFVRGLEDGSIGADDPGVAHLAILVGARPR
jgi:hypothetical protein